jgi:hypothetical protein
VRFKFIHEHRQEFRPRDQATDPTATDCATTPHSGGHADQGQRKEAHMLEGVIAGCTEGFETKEFQESARVLKELQSPSNPIPNASVIDPVAID